MSPLERFFGALDALPDDKLAGALPVALLMFAPLLGDRGLPAPLVETLARFEASLGLAPDADDHAKRAALERHMRAHGLDGALWRDLLAAMRDAGNGEGAADVARRLVGAAATRGVLERKAPPPAGTVGAGPFARFALDKKR